MKKEWSIPSQSLVELDEHTLSKVVGGLIGPDQDISDFPPWLLPRIRFADFGSRLNTTLVQKAFIR